VRVEQSSATVGRPASSVATAEPSWLARLRWRRMGLCRFAWWGAMVRPIGLGGLLAASTVRGVAGNGSLPWADSTATWPRGRCPSSGSTRQHRGARLEPQLRRPWSASDRALTTTACCARLTTRGRCPRSHATSGAADRRVWRGPVDDGFDAPCRVSPRRGPPPATAVNRGPAGYATNVGVSNCTAGVQTTEGPAVCGPLFRHSVGGSVFGYWLRGGWRRVRRWCRRWWGRG
jgi:hypothetical protein